MYDDETEDFFNPRTPSTGESVSNTTSTLASHNDEDVLVSNDDLSGLTSSLDYKAAKLIKY